MPPPRIQPQNPDLSPTYSHSQNAANNNASIPPSIRRNLFAGHLSRRPIPSEMRNTSQMPDPFQSQSPTRQNSSQPDIFQSQPSLLPTHRAGSVGIHDAFDPNISPTRSLSPSNDARYFPSSSIVAVSPQTGRPLLPTMPTLPPRLRLSEGDDDDDGDDPNCDEHGRSSPTAAYRHANDYASHYRSDHDIEYDSSSLLMSMRPPADYGGGFHPSFIDPTTGASGDSRDLERIEQLLSKMQAQQREKAIDTYTMNTSAATSSKVSTRARGKARATGRNPELHSSTASERREPQLGGVGATIDPAEKDEMLGLIMTSLRKKVQQADEEGWMYGNEGVGGSGTYHDEIGVYD